MSRVVGCSHVDLGLQLTPGKMGAEPCPLVRSGEQAVWREDGDMLRSTAGGVGVSDLSCRTPAART